MGILITNGSSPTVVDPETQNSLLYFLREKLNESGILDVDIGISSLDKDSKSACIVVEKTPLKLKTYVDGGYEGEMSVSLYYRTLATHTSAEKMDNLALLNKFNGYLQSVNVSSFTACEIDEISQSELSSLIAVYDNGVEDYGIKIRLAYCK